MEYSHLDTHTQLKESVQGVSLGKIPLKKGKHPGWIPLHLLNRWEVEPQGIEGISPGFGGISPGLGDISPGFGISAQDLLVSRGVQEQQTWEFVALRGPTTRECRSSHWAPGELKGLPLDCCLQGHKRIGFKSYNIPSWLQFRSVAFFESSITKTLLHLGCCSGKESEFPRLFVKTGAR